MSGVAGHILALHEDHDLTFEELKNLLVLLARGYVDSVTEKFDGISLMFSADPITGETRVARNLADIKNGGMSKSDLAARFAGRGELCEAFLDGYDVVSTITQENFATFTSPGGEQLWYAMEIVCPKARITLHYDTNNVVLHERPVLVVSANYVSSSPNALLRVFRPSSCTINGETWHVRGPQRVKLDDVTARSDILLQTLQRIEQIQNVHSLPDRATLRDHMYRCARDECVEAGFNVSFAADVAKRIVKVPSAMTLAQLKRRAGAHRDTVNRLVKDELAMRERYVEPIADAVTQFSIEVLRDINSALIENPDVEIARLKNAVSTTIDDLTSDENMSAAAQKHIKRLRSLDNVTSAIEGVVFVAPSGKTYKLTGAFRAYHQLVSMRRFTRVKAVQDDDRALRDIIKNIVFST